MSRVEVTQGDCVEVLRAREGPLFDAAVTDPPYELGFMGRDWDRSGVAFCVETWRAVFDQLKPGAFLTAFSSTRTYHRMACAIEDAGFEVVDQIAWTYSTGFPKSGWLKPAWEPVCLARKPCAGTRAANVLAHGTGALNIEVCRVPGGERTMLAGGMERKSAPVFGTYAGVEQVNGTTTLGRYPANLAHDGSPEVEALFPSAEARGGLPKVNPSPSGYEGGWDGGNDKVVRNDSGSAARFFYSSKAGPLDRLGSNHPTIKPVDLMRWLVRLVTPAGGLVLDPFGGSGTTGIAAMAEGFDAELIELLPDHVADIERKLTSLRGEGARVMEQHVKQRAARTTREPSPLFGDAA